MLAICFDACCTPLCSICNDTPNGTAKMLLTPTGITTVTNPDPGIGGGRCPTCEDANGVTLELTQVDEVNKIAYAGLIDLYCGFAEVPLDDYCIYLNDALCGRPTVFTYELLSMVMIYKTAGGDIRGIVVFFGQYTNACLGLTVVSDDFLIEAAATKFDCLSYTRTDTVASCYDDNPGCGCSLPTGYTLEVAAA